MRALVALALILPLSTSLACKKKPTTTSVVDAPLPTTKAVTPQQQAMEEVRENFRRVNFAFDSSALDGASKDLLSQNARLMAAHPGISLEVQGHCDERGTTDYNLALGQRRAKAVRDYMTSAGVSPARIKTISMGEERPLVAAAGETAWAQNRRAEFRVYEGGDGKVVGTVP
ncbi:OmpA family protein [Myxococcota bacterium]|nr:OmpA family protein [Myxococcota bacterium]